MRINDLSQSKTAILSDHWLAHPEDREKIAASFQTTVSNVERYLQFFRHFDAKRAEQERDDLLSFFNDEPQPDAPPAIEAVLPEPPAPLMAAMPRVQLNGAIFDIETTDFGTESYAGYMIACCILPLDSDEVQTHAIRFDERGDDLRLLREVLAALAEFDFISGHNSSAFDLGYLHSRWLYHRARGADVGAWPKRWLTFDTYQAAKASAIKTRRGMPPLTKAFRTIHAVTCSPCSYCILGN